MGFFGRENSRNSAYRIDDCFLRFWFRFVFKYGGWLELGRAGDLERLVLRDFDAFRSENWHIPSDRSPLGTCDKVCYASVWKGLD